MVEDLLLLVACCLLLVAEAVAPTEAIRQTGSRVSFILAILAQQISYISSGIYHIRRIRRS